VLRKARTLLSLVGSVLLLGLACSRPELPLDEGELERLPALGYVDSLGRSPGAILRPPGPPVILRV